MKSLPCARRCGALLLLFLLGGSVWAQRPITGRVLDGAHAPVGRAVITVQSPTGTTLTTITANHDGTFSLADLPDGKFTVTVSANGFQSRQVPLSIHNGYAELAPVQLSIVPMGDAVTVTAQRGAVEAVEQSAQVVSIKDEAALRTRPLATLGNALEGAPGILVQQSTYGQVSPFLRGLTGYQVLNLVDGVRFNNATFRSGPNQYLAYIEPSQAERLEALLGPTGAQYGSDALGGTINVLTATPAFANRFTAEWQVFGASADASGGNQAKVTFGTKRLALLFGGAGQKHNDLRAGQGADSRHVLHRFFGLNQSQIRGLLGTRQQDTGFTQYGWHTKAALRLSETQIAFVVVSARRVGRRARVQGFVGRAGPSSLRLCAAGFAFRLRAPRMAEARLAGFVDEHAVGQCPARWFAAAKPAHH